MLCLSAERIDFFQFRFTRDITPSFTRLNLNLLPAENKPPPQNSIIMDPDSTKMRRRTWNPFSSTSPYEPSPQDTQNQSITAAPSTTHAAGNPTDDSPPLSQQSTLQPDSNPEEASIAPNVSNDSPSQPHDATLAQDTRPPIYELGTPSGPGFGNSDPFIQDQGEAPTRELPLDGRKKPWRKRVGSKLSKLLDGFNRNLLYDGGEGFPYPFQGKVRRLKEKRKERKERKRQQGS
jgi:hypothetical protein